MVAPPEAVPGLVHFNSKVRCCTYGPGLPNYLAGSLPRDSDAGLAFGQATLRARMGRRTDVKPWGMRRSIKFENLYQDSGSVFGKAPELACPRLQAGTLGCGIWRHRPVVCATWHCKHDGENWARGSGDRWSWRCARPSGWWRFGVWWRRAPGMILMMALPLETWLRYVVWSLTGLAIYLVFGKKNSALATQE